MPQLCGLQVTSTDPILTPHAAAAGDPWRHFPALNDPFPLTALKARLSPFLAKWPFKFAQECVRTAFPRRARVILPRVLRRAHGRYDLRKRPLRPQLHLCLAAKPALRRAHIQPVPAAPGGAFLPQNHLFQPDTPLSGS